MATKPLGHRGYGTIPHLSGSRLGPSDKKANPGQEEIATKKVRDWRDLVIVQEKLDGSNVAVAKISGEIVPITRAGYMAVDSPYEMHHRFHAWVFFNYSRFHSLLNDGERLVGEWLAQAHGTRYLLPHEMFVAFDIVRGQERTTYMEFLRRTLPLKFVTPRLIHIGQPLSIKNALKMLEPSGHGAIDPVEGAVWRVEREGNVDFLCKYVRSDKVDGCYLDGEPVWNAIGTEAEDGDD